MTMRGDNPEKSRMRSQELMKQGGGLYSTGDFFSALACFDRAIDLNPDLAENYFHRALCHIGLEQYDRALQDCDRALELGLDWPATWFNRSTCRRHTGDQEGALSDLERFLQQCPDDEDALQWRERILQDLEKHVREARKTDFLVSGTDVLVALGIWAAGMLLTGLSVLLLLQVALPWAGTTDGWQGTAVMIAATGLLVIVGLFTLWRKMILIGTSVPWLFQTLLFLRTGRLLVGGLLLGAGLWLASQVGPALWSPEIEWNARDLRSVFLVGGLALLAVGLGLRLILVSPKKR